jgi:hypothetical protein
VWCAAVLMSQQLVDAPYRPMTATATTPAQQRQAVQNVQTTLVQW